MKNLFIDLMYIPMIKQKEDNQFVWYKVKIITQKNSGPMETKYGIFKFNKLYDENNKTANIKTVIELIESETDPLLMEYENDILIRCFPKMNQCKKNNLFPEKTCFASG